MNKNLKSLLVIGVIVVAFSCSKKDDATPATSSSVAPAPAADATPYTVTQADAAIASNSTQFTSEIQSVSTAKSVKALASLSGSLGGTSSLVGRLSVSPGKSFVASFIKNFKSAVLKSYKLSARIDGKLAESKGIYTYNPLTNKFDVNTNSDFIIFIFPDSANRVKGVNGTNNCTFTLSDYEELVISADSTVPTKFSANLTIDNVKEMAVDYSASYISTGEPTDVSASIEINPFKLSEQLSNNNGKASYSTLFENTATSTKIFGYGVDAEGNFNTDEIDKISGYIFLMDIAMEGSINIKVLQDATAGGVKPSQALIDNNISIKLKSYSKGNLIASVKYDATSSTEPFYAVYESDPTVKKPLDEFFAPFLSELQGLDLGGVSKSVL